jgi:signal peptidase I
MSSIRKRLLIIGIAVLAVSGIALVSYRIFFVKMVRVPTGAMANTIVPGDCLVVKRLFGEVKRGDIIIFRYPSQPSIQYVSRVVGLPGESVQMRDTSVYINGKPIPEQRVFVKYPYDFDFGVLDEVSSEGSGPYRVFYFTRDGKLVATVDQSRMKFAVAEPFQIPSNQYFVMGDNRDNSLDSRYQGAVPRDLIWGKPTTIYWSSHQDHSHREAVKWERLGKRVQ